MRASRSTVVARIDQFGGQLLQQVGRRQKTLMSTALANTALERRHSQAPRRFAHYLDLWLKIKANSVAASSYRGYANKAEVHVRPRWGKVQIQNIDHLDLQEWIQVTLSKTLKNKTIHDIISNVRQVFRLYRTRMKVAHDRLRV